VSVRGGIKRLKQHLAGGFGDAKICERVSTEVRKEMAAYLESNKKRRPLFLEDEDGEEVVEVTADEAQQNGTSQASKVRPSLGTAAKRRQATLPYKATADNKIAQQKTTISVVETLRKTPEVVDESMVFKALRRDAATHPQHA